MFIYLFLYLVFILLPVYFQSQLTDVINLLEYDVYAHCPFAIVKVKLDE